MPQFSVRLRALAACGALGAFLLGGCASVGQPHDPLEPINRAVYQFNDKVDIVVLKPVAQAYREVMPQFVRTGVHNFFSNINDVIVALNNLLQGKFANAVNDFGRIVINTSVGMLGIFDVATPAGLEKNNEDFGQTLGYWGVGSGPYLVLPFFGPSNVRDAVGLFVDFKTDPVTYVDPVRTRNVMWGTRIVNRRSELLDTTDLLEAAALDPYEFVRDAYFQRRRHLIYDGKPPPEDYEDFNSNTKSRSGRPGGGSRAADAQTDPATILVSGDEASLTPARFEAREKAAREGRRAEPSQVAAPGAADIQTDQQPSFVRFWPAVSSRP
jgi:phospholipid-binding lipoprotein MlaA